MTFRVWQFHLMAILGTLRHSSLILFKEQIGIGIFSAHFLGRIAFHQMRLEQNFLFKRRFLVFDLPD